MDATSQVILAALRVTPSRPMSREELRTLAGCNDRMVREAISELRSKGWLIVGNVKGYWLSRDREEVYALIERLKQQVCRLEEICMAMKSAADWQFAVECVLSREQGAWREGRGDPARTGNAGYLTGGGV